MKIKQCELVIPLYQIVPLHHCLTSAPVRSVKNISLICFITRLFTNHKTYTNHKTSSVLGLSISRGFRFLETVFLKFKSEKLYTMKNFVSVVISLVVFNFSSFLFYINYIQFPFYNRS